MSTTQTETQEERELRHLKDQYLTTYERLVTTDTPWQYARTLIGLQNRLANAPYHHVVVLHRDQRAPSIEKRIKSDDSVSILFQGLTEKPGPRDSFWADPEIQVRTFVDFLNYIPEVGVDIEGFFISIGKLEDLLTRLKAHGFVLQ